MSACKTFSHQQVHQLLDEVLGPGLHAKRIASLAGATLGVMHTASLAVCTIGHGLAMARGLNARHAVKQVDRMLSNPGIDVDQILALWVPFVIGARTSLLVALDWTDFDADNQATIMLSLITEHGRATPLVWLTVSKAELKDRRSLYERRVLVRRPRSCRRGLASASSPIEASATRIFTGCLPRSCTSSMSFASAAISR